MPQSTAAFSATVSAKPHSPLRGQFEFASLSVVWTKVAKIVRSNTDEVDITLRGSVVSRLQPPQYLRLKSATIPVSGFFLS